MELLREKYIDFNDVFKKKVYDNGKQKHIITNYEWFKCKEYFDFKCAYCGKSELLEQLLNNKSLSKEHVVNLGSGHINNCVPSCNACNVSKGSKLLEDWYGNNINYSKHRRDKIQDWLEIHSLNLKNI